MLNAGDVAPAIELPLDDGSTLSLAALRGKPVVVYFYPKDDTSGCTREAIDFSALRADFDGIGVTVVGISPDPVSLHLKFREKHKLAVALAADEDKQVAEAYGVWQEKKMYGRSYMGIVRSTFLIAADGRIAGIWRKVSIAGHAAEVLAAARELAGKS
jgi:thioredoxin-dependent peroxiredoxin